MPLRERSTPIWRRSIIAWPGVGQKNAIVAVAHSIVMITYHIIQSKELCRELGGDYFDEQRPGTTSKRVIKRLER
jgi:transposase